MKKLLTKILIGALAVTMLLGLTACGSGSTWKETSMKNWGADVASAKQGGFIVEKENYYYYINGVEEHTADNTFGTPVKGALMAVDKNDFTKTEVVVPKLFGAQDFNAGLYIYGDYVYYASPNTDKDSEGEIANDELVFMRTKLDGTDTTEFFKVTSLLDEYRIFKSGNDVCIIYDDSAENAIKLYNCTSKETTIVAEANGEVEGANGESLNAIFFGDIADEYILYYTVTVYAEEYNESKEEDRATESYNKVYGYSVANGSTLLLDGSKDGESARLNPAFYEIKLVDNGVMYYSESINGTAKTYFGYGANKTEVTNTVALSSAILIVSAGEAYTLSDGTIAKTALVGNYNAVTKNVAIGTGASAMHAIVDGNMYFTDADGGISRIKLDDQDANVEKVSNSSVDTEWYDIEFIGGKMFYCDSSAVGASYIKYVDINGEVKAEDTDDDGENDKFYLEGQTFLGKIKEEDKAVIATAKVDAIASELVDSTFEFEKDSEGKLFVKSVNEAVEACKDVEVSEETTALLDKYQKAIEMANLYNRLDGINKDFKDVDALRASYEDVKSQIESFRASDDYTEVSGYITNNLLANYDLAKKLFED